MLSTKGHLNKIYDFGLDIPPDCTPLLFTETSADYSSYLFDPSFLRRKLQSFCRTRVSARPLWFEYHFPNYHNIQSLNVIYRLPEVHKCFDTRKESLGTRSDAEC